MDYDSVRRAYAMQVLAAAQIENPALEDAFAAVKREDYLGSGPWDILRWGKGYVTTPSADPVYLYSNDLVAIDSARYLNNGQPALHALLADRAGPKPGEHAVHIGAGVGYYSAILAEMVGASGRVTAVEYDPELAARAESNLAALPQALVKQGDGAQVEFEPADVIYVNAGATHPAENWITRLRDGGRLILPLTTRRGFNAADDATPIERRGAVFRIERQGEAFLARWISAVAIFPCEGARDEAAEVALAAALDKGGWQEVSSFHYGAELPPAEDCWLTAPGWCLC